MIKSSLSKSGCLVSYLFTRMHYGQKQLHIGSD